MHSRFGDEGPTRGDRSRASSFLPARRETRSERVREIRQRIADDAYRSAEVAEEIARRILLSREL
jgi:hypothetical protein